MEKDLRAKLDELLQKQAEMQKGLQRLGEECSRLDADLRQFSNESLAQAIQHDRAKTEPAKPPPLPPEVKLSALSKATPEERKPEQQESPVSLKIVSEFENYPKADPVTAPGSGPVKTDQQQPLKKTAVNAGEWEINFGQVWLVRIGVLLLLTGLIFLSTYAYKNWLFQAGPGAKVVFFMTISLTLTGVGMWLEKKWERFQQYGRVVASGGLAAGYYTIYASHFVPSLKLVENAILAGFLLTLWAGVMLAYAVWKKSRVVAVMAIGLAFYGTIVNPSGWLALFSALLLSCAGMWLMLRFKWVSIGLGTVGAAYAAHAFWLGGVYPHPVSESVRFTYLACYWLLFTAALIMPKAKSMSGPIQRAFCAINNGATWGLAVFLIPQFTPHAEIGWISIGIGVLWMAISAVARTGKLWDRSLAVVFGYQGILIASLGILLEATGYTRFLILAVEACILMAGARYFGGVLARVASAGAFFCALAMALPEMNGGHLAPWSSYAALALVCAAYTAIVRRDGLHETEPEKGGDLVPLFPATVTWLVAVFGVFNQWSYASGINGLWIAATVIMLAHFLLKPSKWIVGLRDLAMVSVFTALAGIWWYLVGHSELTIYQSILPLLGTFVFWYMCPRLVNTWDSLVENTENPGGVALEWIFSVLFCAMMLGTVSEHLESDTSWMIVAGILAISGNAIAEYTRRHSIGIPAILFHLTALASLVRYGNHEPGLGWMPALLLVIHLVMADVFWNVLEKNLMRVALSLGLIIAVGTHAFQEFDRPDLTLTALGLGLMAWAYYRKDRAFLIAGGVFPMVIACLTTTVIHDAQDWLRYIPITASLAGHALLWKKTSGDGSWKPARVLLLIAGLIALFFSASAHVQESFQGTGLAICWALLATALFCAGLMMRCRPYRLIGLYWLAAAVLHVVFIDVMQMETLGRILSFIILGLVLLALGFLYNRFQDTIRKFI